MRWSLTIILISMWVGIISQKRDSTVVIHVKHTDEFCKAGLDIDSCSYLPLYLSFYKWLGVPYRYSGNSKKGIDCSGLMKVLYRDVYHLELKGSANDIYSRCEPIKKEDLQEGDLVFFKINKSRVSHIGLYLQHGFFVHASVSKGVMINNLAENYYHKYYFSGGRIKLKSKQSE